MVRSLGHGAMYGVPHAQCDGPGFRAALMRADPRREVELHAHEGAHVIVHLEGTYLSSAAGAPREARTPGVVVNPPGTTHRDRYAWDRGAFRGAFLSVAIDAPTWQAWGASPRDAHWLDDPAAMGHAGRALVAARSGDGAAVEDALLALVASVAGELAPAATPGWMPHAIEMLRDTWASPLRVADLARACDVHPVYLARAFRRHVGVGPAAFQRRERVARAAALLACTARPISQVALDCGFAHQSHLTSAFRAALGMTPRAWRLRACKNGDDREDRIRH